jgi:anaerobic magnesium-protoporphyrin IX monomethyl ester cyclase
MNITLISTDRDVWAFGLRSISAVLKAAGHVTQLVHMTTSEKKFSEKSLADVASLARHADLVGVSCLARGSAKAAQLIESLRAQHKLVIWGGVHASLNPAECAEWADIVCRGEGEEMMLELVERLEQGGDWKDVQNLAFREGGALRLNAVRPPVRDLDELPLPDFTFENEYHLTEKGLVQVSTLSEVSKGGRIIFNGSRGCAFHCTYCCNTKIKALYSRKDPYVRRMSVPRFIEHAQSLREIFPQGTYFYFIDEDFAARPIEELVQLSEEFPQKVGLPFQCMAHPARITHQKMDLLVKAGVCRMEMGMESGSERTRREVYDRRVSNKAMTRATQIISTYPQVLPTYLFIIANPYEEREDLVATARFIAGLPYGSQVVIYNLVFFPGSALYERAIGDGLIEGVHDSGYELDFLGGLHYKGHGWKRKNLYLNGLLFLMAGRCRRYRIGLLPRSWINALLAPQQIEFHESHPSAIRVMISIKVFLNRLRYWAAQRLKTILGNPAAVFSFGHHMQMKLSTVRKQWIARFSRSATAEAGDGAIN